MSLTPKLDGVLLVPSRPGKHGLGRDRIHTGGNSGFQAINLAFLFGARRIVLLGFDMSDEAGIHWHGAHLNGLHNPNRDNFKRWRKALGELAVDLELEGVEVVNASRETALECFKRTRIEAIDQ